MYETLISHFSHEPTWLEKAIIKQKDRISTNSDLSGVTLTQAEEQWKPSSKELWIMIALAASSLLVALDATILVSALPTLARDLDGTTAQTFWIGTSYLLAHAVLQPFIAELGSIFGKREALMPSLLLFTVGSIVCGTAREVGSMLAGRVVQGIGGAGIITLSQTTFADIVPLRQRPKYFSIVLGAWALGSVCGPVLGGAFTQKATWRWCFYINLPICGVALPLAWWALGHLRKANTDTLTKLRSVDWIGNAVFIFSLTIGLIGISWAGIEFEWSDWQTLVPLIFGIAGIFAFIAFEYFVADSPFLSRGIFCNASAIASYICAMLQGMALYITLYYVTFYFSAVKLYSPLRSGVSILPAACFTLPGSVVVSRLITRFGHYRWSVWTGYFLSTVSSGLLILLNESTKTAVWAVILCIFGLGMGMILSSVNFSIQAAVAANDAGPAAAMYAFVRSIGMTIGVALGSTVFQNQMKAKLHDLNVSDATRIAKNAEGFVEAFKQMSNVGADGALRQNIMRGYVHGFHGVYIFLTVICALGLVFSLVIRSFSLDKELGDKDEQEEVRWHGYESVDPTRQNKHLKIETSMPRRLNSRLSPDDTSFFTELGWNAKQNLPDRNQSSYDQTRRLDSASPTLPAFSFEQNISNEETPLSASAAEPKRKPSNRSTKGWEDWSSLFQPLKH